MCRTGTHVCGRASTRCTRLAALHAALLDAPRPGHLWLSKEVAAGLRVVVTGAAPDIALSIVAASGVPPAVALGELPGLAGFGIRPGTTVPTTPAAPSGGGGVGGGGAAASAVPITSAPAIGGPTPSAPAAAARAPAPQSPATSTAVAAVAPTAAPATAVDDDGVPAVQASAFNETPLSHCDVNPAILAAARADQASFIKSVELAPARAGKWKPVLSGEGGMESRTDWEYFSPVNDDNLLLGRGSEGIVYLGRWKPVKPGSPAPGHRTTPFHVAVKILEVPATEESQAIIVNEIKMNLSLEHNAARDGLFVRLLAHFSLESFEADELNFTRVYMVQELCLGTLYDRLADAVYGTGDCAPTERETFYVAAGATAVYRMHNPDPGTGSAISHFDVRPVNVFYSGDGRVLLGDFGHSRRLAAPPDAGTCESTSAGAGSGGGSLASIGSTVLRRARRAGLRSFMRSTVVAAKKPHTQHLLVQLPEESKAALASMTLQPPEVYKYSSCEEAGDHSAPPPSAAADVWMVGQTMFGIFSHGALPFVTPPQLQQVQAAPMHAQGVLLLEFHKASVLAGAAPQWELLDRATPPGMIALLGWMLGHTPWKRPSMRVVLHHPAWWRTSTLHFHTNTLSSMLHHPWHNFQLLCQHLEEPVATRMSVPAWTADGSVVPMTLAERVTSAESELTATCPLITTLITSARRSGAGAATRHLVVWMRNFFAHVPDYQDRADVMAECTCLPGESSVRWDNPAELIARHPATGFFWPAFWRALFMQGSELRAYVPADLAAFMPLGLLDGPAVVSGGSCSGGKGVSLSSGSDGGVASLEGEEGLTHFRHPLPTSDDLLGGCGDAPLQSTVLAAAKGLGLVPLQLDRVVAEVNGSPLAGLAAAAAWALHRNLARNPVEFGAAFTCLLAAGRGDGHGGAADASAAINDQRVAGEDEETATPERLAAFASAAGVQVVVLGYPLCAIWRLWHRPPGARVHGRGWLHWHR